MGSGLKIHSLGIVVESKPKGTDYVLVSPIEELNIQKEGKIKDQTKDFSGSKPEIESTDFKTEHESKNYVRAKWLPFSESNRTTAPDVVANETILLLKFGDVDEFYWCDLGREPELRRLEDVLYSWSNLREPLKPYDKTNSYWVHVNTQDKFVHFHTSKSDGEPFEYDVIFDTKKGTVTLTDDVGNFVKLESPKNKLTINTLNEIYVNAKKNITVNTESTNITLKDNAGNSIKLDSPSGTISLVAKSQISLSAPVISESCNTKSSSAANMSIGASSSVAISAANIVNNGNVTNNGNVHNTGSMVTDGPARANPNLNAVFGG